jgi:hypothetical protein
MFRRVRELCGGAAVAMVMRYWGMTWNLCEELFVARGSRAEGHPRRRSDLGESPRAAGVRRHFHGDATLMQRSLDARRPLIAVIEDRPGGFTTSWSSAGRPARSSCTILHGGRFHVHEEQEFLRKWERSAYWTLLFCRPLP